MPVAADQINPIEVDLSLQAGPVAETTVLYKKTCAFRNSGGYLAAVTGSGANRFAGIVRSKVDNSGGANGDLKAEVHTRLRMRVTISGSSQDDVDKPVYATDNSTFTLNGATANAVRVGRFAEYLDGDEAMVEFTVQETPQAVVADVDATVLDAIDATAIAAINGGTINSGDATTDTVITSLKTSAGQVKTVVDSIRTECADYKTVIDSLRTKVNAIFDILEAIGAMKKA